MVAAAWASNLGDGIRVVALPLLMATLTDRAAYVGGVVAATMLPGAILGAPIGVLVDRFDRRRTAILADVGRVVIAVALCLTVATDSTTVWSVFVAAIAMGIGETFRDLVGAALLADAVDDSDLEAATGGLVAAETAGNLMIGPIGGSLLWTLAWPLPFLVDAAALGVSALTTSKLDRAVRPAPTDAAALVPSLRRELGASWLLVLRNRSLRRVGFVSFLTMVALMGLNGVEVLWALDRLDIGAVGFGALNAASAIGAVLISLRMGPLVERIPPRVVLPVVGAINVAVVIGYSVTTYVPAVFVLVFALGASVNAGDVVLRSTRVRAAGPQAVGRVSGVMRTVLWSGGIVGAAGGGLIADRWGLVGTFRVSAAVLAVTAVSALLWSPILDTDR